MNPEPLSTSPTALRFDYIPTVGRIIHVMYTQPQGPLPCRAALVAGYDHQPRRLHLAVFTNRGDQAVAVHNLDDPGNSSIHDPKECPQD